MSSVAKACAVILAVAAMLSACAPVQRGYLESPSTQPSATPATESQPPAQQAGLPNPASVYCEEQGGKVEIRTDADGNQQGVCVFEDGNECDEWAFFRNECQPGQPEPAATAIPGSKYFNEEYGFSFDMPSEWSVEEFADYLLFTRPGYKLFVGFQWADEAPKPFRTGMPQGDFVDSGSASLLGQAVPKRNLVWEGKNKVVDYGGRIKVGDLILVFYLDGEPGAFSYDALDIPPEVIAEADQIIASFALTSRETPQLEFNPTAPID